MYTFLIILTILATVVLVLAVLAQKPKGGGLSAQFGGTSANQFMGVKRTSDLLEKITWGTASLIMLLVVISNTWVAPQTSQNADELSPNIQKAQENISLQPQNNATPLDVEDTNNAQDSLSLENILKETDTLPDVQK